MRNLIAATAAYWAATVAHWVVLTALFLAVFYVTVISFPVEYRDFGAVAGVVAACAVSWLLEELCDWLYGRPVKRGATPIKKPTN